VGFEEYKKQMYIDNVDERLAKGHQVLQYKDYVAMYGEFLAETYKVVIEERADNG
jgi:hypothetical protein